MVLLIPYAGGKTKQQIIHPGGGGGRRGLDKQFAVIGGEEKFHRTRNKVVEK